MASGALSRLITFDIDGTLVRAVGNHTNRLHKGAFSYAFKQVFGIDGTIDAIHHHGSTDPLVCVNTLFHYGIPKEESEKNIDEIKQKMLEYARENEHEAGDGLEVLPGIPTLLHDLAGRKNVSIGLVTGNLEEIAWMKMNALGIKKCFSVPNFGGFGSDHTERTELVKIAAVRAEKYFDRKFKLRFHVGDTPADIRAAVEGGAHAIGVCTGAFSKEQLLETVRELGATEKSTILENIYDNPEDFYRACKLDP